MGLERGHPDPSSPLPLVRSSTTRTTAMLLSLSAIDALALAWWLILYFDDPSGSPSLSGLRLAAPVVLTVVIPMVGAMAWRFRRRLGAALTRWGRAYILVSLIFLTLSWLPAAAMTAFLLWLEEPWPLSLQQGPDTSRALSVFQQNFGVEPSVSNVYAHVEWRGAMYIAFSFEDAAVVDRIVKRRDLRPAPPNEATEIGVSGPPWFPRSEALGLIPEKYVDDTRPGREPTVMWVDRVRRRVLFLDPG
jgi:hypothetical protein